ncbi:protein MET1, chloroplastic [Trifolium repens]|nr:protein MET1, chloroplastic [Trifolium repens]
MFEWLRYDQIKTFNICSAVFGTEIWPAVEYGRTTYTICQRIGPLLMRMQKRYDIKLIRTDTTLDLSQKAEKGRDGGTYMLDQLIRLESDYVLATRFVATGQYQHIMVKCHFWDQNLANCRIWKNNVHNSPNSWPVIMIMQKIYGQIKTSGDLTEKEIIRTERNSDVIQVALSSLEEALNSDLEDCKRIRTGIDLANVRAFVELVEQYDSITFHFPLFK